MNDKYEKWKMLRQKLIYDNFFRLYEETVKLPDGEITNYVVNRGGSAVAILVTLEKEEFLLAYQYRYPIDSWIYDLPGGKVRDGESLEDAVVRECVEETGYKPRRLYKLVHFHPQPSRSDRLLHIFFSKGAVKISDATSFATEKVCAKILNKEELMRLVQENKIVDPALLIAWHTARLHELI